jgi:hypothetical protein
LALQSFLSAERSSRKSSKNAITIFSAKAKEGYYNS